MGNVLSVADIIHPEYAGLRQDWSKWRDVYEGGDAFIDRYLKTFSKREGRDAFAMRREITYNPAFAKEAVDEILKSIFQRLVDVSRKGGSESYNSAIAGEDGGIDLCGSSMMSFIGRKVLPELLPMARVGVYVDMPPLSGSTLIETLGARPFVSVYCAEDIRSWCYDENSDCTEFSNILLKDYFYEYDSNTGLPVGQVCRFKRLWLRDGVVVCQYYDSSGKEIFEDGTLAAGDNSEIILDIPRIPFYMAKLSSSLLSEASNYQIALLNLASSDMAYALYSNFPFYTEQFEARSLNEFIRKPSTTQGGESSDASSAKTEEVKVGSTTGRRYPKGLERPQFIHPSSEPLKASMDKQEQLKYEIRQLVNLSVANLQPRGLSAESKRAEDNGLECGLSYIGLELEMMERKIADYWNMYEGKGVATVNYPETYEIRSPEEKQTEAKNLKDVSVVVPSATFQKAVAKRIVRLTVSSKVSSDELKKIDSEIDKAPGYTTDSTLIMQDVEIGICDLETASKLRGYPEGTAKKAANDHAERLARIAESQANANPASDPAARGIKDQSGNPTGGGSQEKKKSLDTTKDGTVTNKQRGEGK